MAIFATKTDRYLDKALAHKDEAAMVVMGLGIIGTLAQTYRVFKSAQMSQLNRDMEAELQKLRAMK